MASTETTVVIANAVSMTASTANVISAAQSVEGGYGGIINVVLTNGATGPTIPAQAQLQVSSSTAGSIWGNHYGPLVGLTANFVAAVSGTTNEAGVARFSIPYEAGVKRIRVVSGSNTGQAVVLDVEVSNVTAT